MDRPAPARDDAVRVYWQPGCTSCLRTKEYLARHRVPFLSRNVLGDEGALEELAHFGLNQVPIVTRGDRWADGQVLKDVAELAGIADREHVPLPVKVLRDRLNRILSATRRFAAQVPESRLGDLLPNRPRSYADLVFHIFNIADAFLEHEAGVDLVFDAYNRVPAPGSADRAALTTYGDGVMSRLENWWTGAGASVDWGRPARVYYGRQTMHEFLERTTWHAGQHARQLMWVLDEKLAIEPDGPLGADTWRGLPMPAAIWDS